MFDGFWHGIFGGLFGAPLGKWLSKFKYRVILLVAMLSVQCFFFFGTAWHFGLKEAVSRIFLDTSHLVIFIGVSLGIGILAVAVAFVGAWHTPNAGDLDRKQK